MTSSAIYQPPRAQSLLNPVERISEILFGLIMALTFTCTINILQADRSEVRDTLIGAIGCNIAWGVVDAVMFIVGTLAERGRNKSILHFVQKTSEMELANQYISDALPPVVASVLSTEQLNSIRMSLQHVPEKDTKVNLRFADLKTALGIFLLVFISTFPVALPFLFIHEPKLALRVSNLVAIVSMFICGWFIAGYGGYNKLVTSVAMTLIGVAMVGLAISLGG